MITAAASPGTADSHRVVPLARDVRTWLLCGAVVTIGTTLRLIGSDTAYDLYVDEFIYAHLGSSVAAGELPPITDDGYFLIHPPGFFLFAAAWTSVFGDPADPIVGVHMLRGAQQLLSALTAVAIFAITRTAAGALAGAAAALLFAVDPFILRQNGRILLETTTMALLLLGLWLLLRLLRSDAPRWAAVFPGLAFGAAVLTKDMALLLVVAALAGALLSRGTRKSVVLVTAAAAAVPYVVYIAWLAGRGLLGSFLAVKSDGIDRLIGRSIPTGYNSGSGPGLVEVIAARVGEFGSSFAILAVGGVAGLWLALRPRSPEERTIGALAVGAQLMVGYGMLRATSDEHLFYFAIVPAVIALVVGTSNVASKRDWFRRTNAPATSVAVLLSVVVAADLALWAYGRTTPDDAQQRVATWIAEETERGELVAWVARQTPLSLPDAEGLRYARLSDPDTMAAVSRSEPFLLVVLEKEIAEGYTDVSPDTLEFYTERSDIVYEVPSRSYGRVLVYEVEAATGW